MGFMWDRVTQLTLTGFLGIALLVSVAGGCYAIYQVSPLILLVGGIGVLLVIAFLVFRSLLYVISAGGHS